MSRALRDGNLAPQPSVRRAAFPLLRSVFLVNNRHPLSVELKADALKFYKGVAAVGELRFSHIAHVRVELQRLAGGGGSIGGTAQRIVLTLIDPSVKPWELIMPKGEGDREALLRWRSALYSVLWVDRSFDEDEELWDTLWDESTAEAAAADDGASSSAPDPLVPPTPAASASSDGAAAVPPLPPSSLALPPPNDFHVLLPHGAGKLSFPREALVAARSLSGYKAMIFGVIKLQAERAAAAAAAAGDAAAGLAKLAKLGAHRYVLRRGRAMALDDWIDESAGFGAKVSFRRHAKLRVEPAHLQPEEAFSVSVPIFHVKENTGERPYTQFRVVVQHGRLRWDVQRRHKEFKELHAQLGTWLLSAHARAGSNARRARKPAAGVPIFPGAEALPGKVPMMPKVQHRIGKLNLSRAFVEKRRSALEKWLRCVVQIPGVLESVKLMEFIGMLSTSRATSTRPSLHVDNLAKYARAGDVILFRNVSELAGMQVRPLCSPRLAQRQTSLRGPQISALTRSLALPPPTRTDILLHFTARRDACGVGPRRPRRPAPRLRPLAFPYS
jgi:hypothetical protein